MGKSNVLLLLLLAYFAPAFDCFCAEHHVFSSCECGIINYNREEQYVLNCTDIGFTNVSILSHLPEETQVLIFTGNNIPELPWNLFGTTKNHSKLKIIDMSNNKIKLIHGKSFHHVSSVERLFLNRNQISISSSGPANPRHPRVFSNFEHLIELHMTDAFTDDAEGLAEDLYDIFIGSELKELKKIHLEQNEITRFKDPKIFCELPSIMDLYLANNKLEAIEFEVACLSHLRFIDLEKNSISVIGVSDMERLDAVARRGQKLLIDLAGNPLSCGPQLEAFYSWLECSDVEIRNKGKLKCTEKMDNRTCSVVVTPAGCHPQTRSVLGSQLKSSEASPQSSQEPPFFILLILITSLFMNGYFIYFKKFPQDPIGSWVKSFSQAFTSSVQYTKQSNLDDI